MSGAEVCATLARHGFAQVRQSGDHAIIMQQRTSTTTLTVPVPLHKELRTGTLRSIIRQSGLNRSLCEAS